MTDVPEDDFTKREFLKISTFQEPFSLVTSFPSSAELHLH